MALTKQYRIEISADAAGQTVADLTKKLAQLDKSLEGLDADAAKAVRAEMAKVVAELDAAESAAAGFADQLDKLTPGSIGALEAEIEELEQAWRRTVKGTAEFDRALLALGNKKGELKALEDAVDALDPKMKAAAFVDFANGVVGAFTVATAAAETFGLSKETAEAYQQKLLTLISIMQGVEQVSRALNSETMSVVKSTLNGAKALWASALAWLGFGSAATAGSEAAVEGAIAADEAIVSTGIGAVLVGLGLLLAGLIALWAKFGSESGNSASAWTRFKAVVMGGLSALWQATKDYYKILWNIITFDFPEAWETARESGKKVAGAYAQGRQDVLDEAHRAELAKEVEHSERILKVMQAQGVDTERFEREIQRKKVAALKQGSKEYADAVAEYAAFNATARRKHQQEAEAETLAHLNRLLAMEQAAGRSTYQAQLDIEQQKLKDLLAAPQRDRAAIEAQQGVIAALRITHEKDLNDRLFALRQAGLDGRIALDQQKGEDAYKNQLRHEEQALRHLEEAGTRDEAAIRKQKDAIALLTLTHNQELSEKERRQQAYAYAINIAELEKQGKETLDLRLKYAELIFSLDKTTTEKEREQKRADYEALLALQVTYNAREREIRDGQREDRAEQEATGREAERAFISAALDSNTQLVTESLAKKKPDLGLALIKALFGMDGAKAQELKRAITEMAGMLAEAGGELAGALLDGAMQQTQAALDAAQQQLQEASDKLSEAQSRANDTASKIEAAQGARKQYLLERLARERQEVATLAAAKAKAAQEEKRQTEEKHRLEKISAQLAAGSALATNLATAAQAVYAGVKAVSAGSSLPFPANIVAIVAGIAAVAAAVASAKQLANASKYEAGGLIAGPRHADGGVPFTVAGRPGFEAEGGEFIFSRAAVARHGVPLLQMMNDSARTYVKPHPTGHFAAGGVVAGNAAGMPAGMVAIGSADLAALLDTNRAMLGHLQGIHGATEATERHTEAVKNYGPSRLSIGPQEARDIDAQKQAADQAEGFATLS